MPRRHNRAQAEAFNANSILGDDYKFTLDPEEAARRKARRRERAEASRLRLAETHQRDWSTCIVDGCKFQVPKRLRGGIEFPVCTPHAVAVWMDVEARAEEPEIQEATAALRARRQAESQEREAQEQAEEDAYQRRYRAGLVPGDIYFIRANGLIKVGWSADVERRLKSYGPGIEVLCVYAGTRQDETTLHQQLTPSRAKGREWYHDDAIMQAFVADAVTKHGRPNIVIRWTAPGDVVAAKRVQRGAR